MKKVRHINRHDFIKKQLIGNEIVLDIGCAHGDSTHYYSDKCKLIYGIDPSENLILLARKKFPHINFSVGSAEKIPFENECFDAVIMGDVLEHVNYEEKSLQEAYRILKKNGKLILTTPHKGLFWFMDVDNYSWYYRRIFGIKTNKPGYENKHRHYNIEELKTLFDGKFIIDNYYLSSFFLFPLALNLRLFIRKVFGDMIEMRIKHIFTKICELDYSVPYGKFSYCAGICAKKFKDTTSIKL